MRLRADAGYFAGDLARAAHAEGTGFAICTKRIEPLWRTRRDRRGRLNRRQRDDRHAGRGRGLPPRLVASRHLPADPPGPPGRRRRAGLRRPCPGSSCGSCSAATSATDRPHLRSPRRRTPTTTPRPRSHLSWKQHRRATRTTGGQRELPGSPAGHDGNLALTQAAHATTACMRHERDGHMLYP